MKLFTQKCAIRLACLFAGLGLGILGAGSCMIRMPGRSHRGSLSSLTPEETALAASLRRDVEELAGRIGGRSVHAHAALQRAAAYVETRFRDAGFAPERQTFEVDGKPYSNIEVRIPGSSRPGEIVIVGAHYDAPGPGANDNASGTAALLAIAAATARSSPVRTLRFVAFCNEEPPFFQTEHMGSLVYAKRCRERAEDVVAMISLETIGYYSDREGSQRYPAPLSLFYPSKGDFVAFVGNVGSRALVRDLIEDFRSHTRFPSEGAALPGGLTGVGWSDHWSFWQAGYPAVMITDTAVFRYPEYHTPKDLPDQVDTDRCARVVAGVERVVRRLAGVPP